MVVEAVFVVVPVALGLINCTVGETQLSNVTLAVLVIVPHKFVASILKVFKPGASATLLVNNP
jgi:hypothetical protein